MRFARARREPARVDVTPLIDIIFQLVIFFMVSTTFLAAPGFEVDLPRSSAEAVLTDREDLDVWLTTAGEVYVDDQPVDWQGLTRRLEAAARKDPSTLVIIKADTAVGHGRVVQLMDLARSRGLSRLAIATDPQGQASEGSEGSPDN